MDAFKWLAVGVLAFFAYIIYSLNSPAPAAPDLTASPSLSGPVITVDSDNFNTTILDAVGPVLVEFYKPGDVMCERIAPEVARIAEEYADKVTVTAIDVTNSPGLARRYGVKGTPTFIVMNDGDITSQFSGYSRGLVLKHLGDVGVR